MGWILFHICAPMAETEQKIEPFGGARDEGEAALKAGGCYLCNKQLSDINKHAKKEIN
jgi:hypothetical protein